MMMNLIPHSTLAQSFRRRWSLGAALLLAGLLGLSPAAQAIKDTELDTPYVQTPDSVVDAMLDIVDVQPGEFVIDLGAGDGRLLIGAALRGGQGFGVEIDPRLVELANQNARQAGVAERAVFLEQDLFQTDLSQADVMLVYLLPAVNRKLTPAILALRPGTRVVSHDYAFGDWPADRIVTVDAPNKPVNAVKTSDLKFYVVPAQVAGTWRGQSEAGSWQLDLDQEFQMVSGSLRMGETQFPLVQGRLLGNTMRLMAGDGAAFWQFDLTVDGERVQGHAQLGEARVEWQGERVSP